MQKAQADVKTKSENKQAIFRYILNHDAATKQQLFSELGLSLPTIKQALETLESSGLIVPGEKVSNTGGRNAVSYQIIAGSRYAIGLFLSLHHLICASVNLFGEVLVAERVERKLDLQDKGYMQQLASLVQRVRARTPLSTDALLGVGIALPTLVGESGEAAIHGMTSDFTGVTRRFFAEYIPYPVRIYHDSETAGFAEIWRAAERTNMVYLSLNSSIGSSIYLNGAIYNGNNHRAGELGHIIIDLSSKKRCYCGRTGCFDTLCSTNVLESYSAGNLQKFFTLLTAGDDGAKQLWDTYTEHLAVAIHNLRMLFDCTIVIGGYIGSFIGPFMEGLYRKVDKRSIFTPFARTYLFPCRFKTEATAAGAALRMIDEFISGI